VRRRPCLAALALLLCACGRQEDGQAEAAPPSILVILADDLGWRDLGYGGSTFYRTPHIDALAAESAVFTQSYAASPVCTPTRASFLTGRHPARLKLTKALVANARVPLHDPTKRPFLEAETLDHLPRETGTFVERLHDAGYRTGIVGKWHLGFAPHVPRLYGFDFAIGGGGQAGPESYFAPYGIPSLADAPAGEYLTDRLTDEAIDFVRQAADQPFFLLLSHYAVHNPYQAKPELEAGYLRRMEEGAAQYNPTYAAMIDSLDQSVGRMLSTLEELGIRERTIVVFLSDNGGLLEKRVRRRRDPILYPVTSNLPLRGGKGSLYEGGVRIPTLIRWPGVTEAGVEIAVPITTMDFFPSLLEMAGQPPRPEGLDGQSLVPLLTRSGSLERDALYFHLPHQSLCSSVRMGRYKLIRFWGRSTELYDLEADVGETNDLAQTEPERREELEARLDRWLTEVDANLPVPNPAFVPDQVR